MMNAGLQQIDHERNVLLNHQQEPTMGVHATPDTLQYGHQQASNRMLIGHTTHTTIFSWLIHLLDICIQHRVREYKNSACRLLALYLLCNILVLVIATS
uniref:Uncharacterized protein n=1 Tax=Ditylenchus dipsaci TaxID=166011 RepID=A0A915EGA7_9BILA